MAQSRLSLDESQFKCSICLAVLKDPVTVPCGHSFCSVCLTSYWDSQLVCRCPHCRATFSPRPTLGRNTLLTELIQRLGAAHLGQAPSAPALGPDPGPAGRQGFQHVTFDVSSVCPESTVGEKNVLETQHYLAHQITEKESERRQLQQAMESFPRLAEAAIKDSGEIFSELQEFFERRRVEVKELVRAQEKAEAVRAENRLRRLERHICELREREAALQIPSRPHDRSRLMAQARESFCSPVQVGENPCAIVNPHVSFGGVRKAIRDMKERLLGFDGTEFVNITTAVRNVRILQAANSTKAMEKCHLAKLPALDNRSALLHYFCPLSLDPFTAHRELVLTQENRVVRRTGEPQPYSDHPDRFDGWVQVMCCEGLQGISYWEVEWDGHQVAVGLAYESIKRKGSSNESRLGYNRFSWSLCCSGSSYSFVHANQTIGLSAGAACRRIGVFLHHDDGLLCFYEVQTEGFRLLHRVKTEFEQPLYPAMWLGAEAAVNLRAID